jgi:hypothetical protein
MEKISWTDHVKNEEVLLRVKEAASVVLASDTQVRGFKPGRNRRVFKGR